METKILNSRKELRLALQQAKYFTFDQEGNARTWFFQQKLCNVFELSSKLQERVHDKLDKYFNGPRYLYIFDDLPQAKSFIDVNLNLYEEKVCNPDSSELAYTLLLATATTDTILQFDFRFLRIYQKNKEKGAIPELHRWRAINQCLKDMNLVIKNFINKE